MKPKKAPRMVRQCTICPHPRRAEIDAAGDQRVTSVAKAFGVPLRNLQRHRAHAGPPSADVRTKTSAEASPTPRGVRTPKEVALDTLEALQRALDKAPAADVPRIANAMTAAAKLLAKLSGDIELTEAQVIRSGAFRRVQGRMHAVLTRFPDCAKAMAEAFAEGATQ
jgi:hypothetical protein